MAKFILIVIFWGCNIAFAQKLKPSDKTEIIKVMNMQESSWSNGDAEGYMQGYWKSDSLRFITKKGVIYGWQNMLDRYKKSYPDKNAMGKLKFSELTFEALSRHKILVTGKWTLTRTEDELSGYFTLIWQKIKGKWVIVLDHTS
jgi:hypothetical protein